MIPYLILKELVLAGVRFSYESYDHKKAMEEIEQITRSGKAIQYQPKNMFQFANTSYGVPDEIKLNHIVWRTGKLRLVFFDKDGQMCRFKIGQRYYKNFYLEDFGVRVKPMIFKSDDEHNLISQGLAVEETI